MATLTGQQIDLSYLGLIKTNDSAAIGAVAKPLSDGDGNAINMEIGTGAIKFPSGTVDFTGSTVTGLPVAAGPFSPVSLTGTAQTLDLSQYNFGDGGQLSGNTTLAFSNVPTEKLFSYSYTVATAPFSLEGSALSGNTVSLSGGQGNTLSGFSYDGTKMWIGRGDSSGDALKQWNLSTAWDITTATYSNISFNLEGQDNQVGPQMYFKQDGTSFWIVGAQNDSVLQYNMSTANDLSTATYSGSSFSIAGQEASPRGVWFKPDGLKFFVIGNNDRVYSYSMSTAFDLSTASYDNVDFSVQAQDTNPEGLAFSEDGTKFYYAGETSKSLFEYNLSTAWDLSTASYNNITIDTGAIAIRGVAYKTGGTKFFTSSRSSLEVLEINPGVSTLTLPSSVQNPPALTFAAGDVVTQTFYTLDGGGKVYYEEEPQPAIAAPGMISGTGTDSIVSGPAVTSATAVAQGAGAIAIGNAAFANTANNISIGNAVETNGNNLINIGDNNDMGSFVTNSVLVRPGGGTGIAFRGDSVTIGHDTYPGAAGIAIGKGATGLNNNPNICIGRNAEANNSAVAIGDGASARGNGTVVIGAGSTADNAGADGQIAIGDASDCSANRGIVIGVNGCTIASEGIAMGDNVDIATSDRAIAIGNAITIAGSADSITIGTQANVTAADGIVIGRDTSATAAKAVAIGRDVVAAKAATVAVNELETKLAGGGITMVSPNGTEYKLTVSDAGALVIT